MKIALMFAPLLTVGMLFFAARSAGETSFETDTIKTSAGALKITFIGTRHSCWTSTGRSSTSIRSASWRTTPNYQADLVLVTHHHSDHLDPPALERIRTDKTVVIFTEKCAEEIEGGTVMKNGDRQTISGVEIEAVPRTTSFTSARAASPFTQGRGKRYVLTFGTRGCTSRATQRTLPR